MTAPPSGSPRGVPRPIDLSRADVWDRATVIPAGQVALPPVRLTIPLGPGTSPPSLPGEVRVSRVTFEGSRPGWEVALPLAAGQAVFGGGESFSSVDLCGTRRLLLNRETHGETLPAAPYLNAPFFWSTAGWGLLLGTGGPVLADIGDGDPARARFVALGSEVELTLFRGDPASILESCTELTGRAGDWPDWAFGTWMSRASYLNASELHATLDELTAAGCPVDVIHVDAWLAGNVCRELTCSWQVDRARFPEGWTDRLRARGVRSSVWLNPFVLAGSPLGGELARAGLLLRDHGGSPAATCDRANRHIIDFTNPAAVAWWGGQIRRLLREEKPDGLKLDFGEEIPFEALCHDGRSGLEIRNSYALLYQRATVDAIPPEHPAVPFFCRSGTVGSQRTPCHWVGDSPSTWDGMAAALRACLELSLSGFALVSHDAGGFYTPGSKEIPARLLDGEAGSFTADVDPELFGRWAQWAAFSPVTRFHGTGRREPTAYPEPWRSAAIAALRTRRHLLPLLRKAYSESQRTGMPMMRPVALAHPHDRGARPAWHQYQLGPDLIVAPVLAPGGRATVWLPDAEWVPVLGGPNLSRAGLHEVTVAPEAFPAYARPGALATS